jgi:hypothetical protein
MKRSALNAVLAKRSAQKFSSSMKGLKRPRSSNRKEALKPLLKKRWRHAQQNVSIGRNDQFDLIPVRRRFNFDVTVTNRRGWTGI